MNNIIRFWNRNRGMVIFGVIALVLLIIIVHLLNDIAKENNKQKNTIVLTETEKNLPTKSIIGDDSISIDESKKDVEIINEFIDYCNNGKTQEAYDMLTDYCKEDLYPTIETFEDGYRKIIFSDKRIGDISNFTSNKKRITYLVKYYENALSEGKTENLESFQDYITIDENAENGKLNIGGLICINEINKESEKNGIKIAILSQSIYKDYEKFNIKVENTNDKSISIYTGKNTKAIGALGENQVMYNSNIYELASSLYEIPSNMYRTYKLKFKKIYSSNVIIKGIVFSDIIEDFEKYKEVPEEYTDRLIMTVSL